MVAVFRYHCLAGVAWVGSLYAAVAMEIQVSSNAELQKAARSARPGDEIILTGGPFSGVHLTGLTGTRDAPIVVRGHSLEQPARFRDGTTGLHLSGARYVTLRHLDIRGASGNGINIDDAGNPEMSATGILIDDCRIIDIGPKGNHDGLKMSGVDEFTVRNCSFEGWGGSAIDMVGCHDGVVTRCTFTGKEGYSQSNAVQMKGGSARIRVLRNSFLEAGQRSINIGGGTGRPYFRPRVEDFEAKDIEVAGNRFVGSISPIAWVSCSGGHVHHNTFVLPEKWIARILQEGDIEEVKPAHGGVFENNLVVYDDRVRTAVNVGPNTAPGTFIFRRNAWFQTGNAVEARTPSLPTTETEGVYGVDPHLASREAVDWVITSTDPALAGIGADAFRE